MNKKGLLIVITGPSGVGKRTVWTPLFEEKDLNLVFSISMTTRKQREGEINGVDYYFVTFKEFEQAIKDHKLLEYATYADNYYGTPLDLVNNMRNQGKNVVLEIEPQGGLNIIHYCQKNHDDGLLTIFIAPPSIEELKNRLINRHTESMETINKRIAVAEWEVEQSKQYQYKIINEKGDPSKATNELRDIIKKEMKARGL